MLVYITVVSQIKNPLDVTMAYTLHIGKVLAKPLQALGLSGKTMVCNKLLLLHSIQDCVLVQKNVPVSPVHTTMDQLRALPIYGVSLRVSDSCFDYVYQNLVFCCL